MEVLIEDSCFDKKTGIYSIETRTKRADVPATESDDWRETLEEKLGMLRDSWIINIKFTTFRDLKEVPYTFSSASIRPYIPGYGCDGTTDGSIHLITRKYLAYLGMDYDKLHNKAYPDRADDPVEICEKYDAIIALETFIPPMEKIDPLILLSDLMEINNYTFAGVIGEEFVRRGLVSENWTWERCDDAFKERQQGMIALYNNAFNEDSTTLVKEFFGCTSVITQ